MLVAQSAMRFMIAAGDFLFRTRNAVFPLLFVLIALASKPRPLFGRTEADFWLDLAGLCVILSGQALRALVIGLAYIRRGGKHGRIYADDLVVDGLFAHSRNPLYLGNLLVYAGLLMVLNSPAAWLIGAPFYFFAYWAITLAEEAFLGGKFGQAYEEYRRRVNRFLPSPAGLGATIRSMRFDWRRVVRKEYGATFAWITSFLALLVYEGITWRGTDVPNPEFRAIGVVWILAILGYAIARFLKKTGRLNSE